MLSSEYLASLPKPRLGVEANVRGRIECIEIPQFALRFASLSRIPLAAVKTNIFHPNLATIQRNQADDDLGKFPIDNARTSTNLSADRFVSSAANAHNASYPIRLVGDIEASSNVVFNGNQTNFFEMKPVGAGSLRRTGSLGHNDRSRTSCVSGYECARSLPHQKQDTVFRFNRIRTVLSDRPTHGHLPPKCSFNTQPAVDSIGRRVESVTASNYRRNDGIRYSNCPKTEPFKPYGNANPRFNNYIEHYPRI